MRYAADLHLHSHYAKAVSPQMNVETISLWARRKGIDLIGTGDCLQPAWLSELEEKLQSAEAGLFELRPELEKTALQKLPPTLQSPLRYVLSTEVCCAPPGTGELNGVHHLLYFRSFASVRRFQQRLSRHGDLTEGRPTLRLNSRELLETVLEHGDGCHLVPAHVWNPFFSAFGSQGGAASLAELFGDLAPQITLVETGLTSTPTMCRRFSELDRSALFSCSDAHSPENLGRECTLLDTVPGYDALFAALRGILPGQVLGTIKVPVERTRYYRNRCTRCQKSFDADRCPSCGGKLVMGSRDRLEILADRRAAVVPGNFPPYRMALPLRDVLAELCQLGRETKEVDRLYFHLLSNLGHERFILMDASLDAIASVATPQLARRITDQRQNPPGARAEPKRDSSADQMSLTLN